MSLHPTDLTSPPVADEQQQAGEPQVMTPAPPALELDGISLAFREKRSSLPVLQDVSLTVKPGEFVSLIGPSGSGKSTLFHIIGGLLKPQQGRIRMHGQDVTGERGHISYMPQQPALFPWRTTLDNILLGQENAPRKDAVAESRYVSERERRKEALQWLEQVGLGKFAKAYPHTLSGGMQQRAAFLRALLSPQELMLLDEPFSALDALTRADMQQWLLRMWEKNRRSVLFITHSIEEALLLSDRIYVLSARPASVMHVVDVPFPRPRREEITLDPRFMEWKRTMTGWMREEKHKLDGDMDTAESVRKNTSDGGVNHYE
ncbi:ABC-type nitrate/sulfonate/bicarbonate transport system ATPase subunit [Paenibacillus jamilae]|jgi:ABC-type nitrate/sulfonate/bicarbonate transport system ATPase subunit|uniref:ABC transporter ATP-binding protein n=1 Tax=Paenibacillus TaxID=44249 RepID=UPI0002D8E49D|nr:MULTISPECIES: ABC transporter ATP-binding protein [Paenibacillus]MDP9679159.1 ABC-type nitrate/sulfonate/bicarbonate transport system ATPase subunit [Paenibacillus jamilae]MBE3648684.1 ABC transporter ATP-binding protein [Paenibacillus polymyxa]MBY0025039.1 ABC transporter ATP-binding protein [Paenibacillus polymyxa]MBY0058741.1 ABC transporter ATP-binding protein [Paenibacillus polymyxa]MBY0072160.1 ABC transporter ATP-binding protein [Paenibacillus polymyxa]